MRALVLALAMSACAPAGEFERALSRASDAQTTTPANLFSDKSTWLCVAYELYAEPSSAFERQFLSVTRAKFDDFDNLAYIYVGTARATRVGVSDDKGFALVRYHKQSLQVRFESRPPVACLPPNDELALRRDSSGSIYLKLLGWEKRNADVVSTGPR